MVGGWGKGGGGGRCERCVLPHFPSIPLFFCLLAQLSGTLTLCSAFFDSIQNTDSTNQSQNEQINQSLIQTQCLKIESHILTSCLILSYLIYPVVWGTTLNFTNSFLHFSRFSAFCSMIFHSRPVHSLMLSSHRFLCLPLRLPP